MASVLETEGLGKVAGRVAATEAYSYVAAHPLRVLLAGSIVASLPGIAHMVLATHSLPDFNHATDGWDVAGKVLDGSGLIFGGAAAAIAPAWATLNIVRKLSGETHSAQDFFKPTRMLRTK